MVKVKGPIGSAAATGTFGGSAVFSRWKGRTYVRTKITPTNPKTALQVANREMLAFLAQQWHNIPNADQATWYQLAFQKQVSFYHAYVALNLDRWRHFKPPTQLHPATETGTLPTATLDSATGMPSAAKLTFSINNERNWWSLLIFRSLTTPVIPSRQTLITVQPRNETGTLIYLDQNLPPATYYYQARFCTSTGKMGPNETQRTATVT
jgi:hypothetical protein